MSNVDGYSTTIPYALGWCEQIFPPWLDLAAITAGIAPPRTHDEAPYRFCDLGCGRGASLTLMAAADGRGEFVGIDAMAAHVNEAAARAREIDIQNVSFLEGTFADALGWDLPPFDYVVAHGVWTWVNHQNRTRMLAFAARFLKPGGLLYLGYNCLPGWSSMIPLQRLLHQSALAHPDETAHRQIALGVAQLEALRKAGAPVLHGDPAVEDFMTIVRGAPVAYLAHEYLHDGWEPAWAADVHRAVAGIGLQFVATSRLREMREDFVLRQAQRELLADSTDPLRYEELKDFCLDRNFRCDVFSAGAALDADSRWERRLDQRVALKRPSVEISFERSTPAGRLRFDNEAARAIVTALESGPCRLREIAHGPGAETATEADVLNSADALFATEQIVPVGAHSPRATVARMNTHLRALAAGPDAVAAQATEWGVAVRCSRLEQLLLDRRIADPAVVHSELARLEQTSASARAALGLEDERQSVEAAVEQLVYTHPARVEWLSNLGVTVVDA